MNIEKLSKNKSKSGLKSMEKKWVFSHKQHWSRLNVGGGTVPKLWGSYHKGTVTPKIQSSPPNGQDHLVRRPE